MRAAGAGLLLLGILTLTTAAQAAHITDKMAVGLYDTPGDETPERVLTSGTPLEILDRSGRLCKVRLGNGDGGWLECRYVTDEKPARAMLVESQARAGQLWDQVEELQRKLEAQQQRLQELELQLRAAERIATEQGAGPVSVAFASTERDAIERPRSDARAKWDLERLLPALLGATGGFTLGALLLFWRYHRRYGGLSI